MARIDNAVLAAVAARATELDSSAASLAQLRREWPGIHFTFCDDDDVPARLSPARDGENIRLYLVSNAEHCIAFTSQPEAATGIVLAVVSQD